MKRLLFIAIALSQVALAQNPGPADFGFAAPPAPCIYPSQAVYYWTPSAGSSSLAYAIDSVSANNAFQATGGNQPTYNATGAPNSHPSLTLNGTSDFITPTTPIPASPTAFTLWALIKPSSVTVNNAIFGGTTGGIEYRINSSGNPDVLVQSTADVNSGSQMLTASTWTMQVVTFNFSTIAFYEAVGGNLVSHGSGSPAATSFTSTTNDLGGAPTTAEYFHGDIAEWGYVNSVNTANIAYWSKCHYGV